MIGFRERIKDRRKQEQRKVYLENLLIRLERDQKRLQESIQELERGRQIRPASADEQKGRSLADFYRDVIQGGQPQDSYAAAVKYDMAAQELESVMAEEVRSREELAELVQDLEHRKRLTRAWIQEVKEEWGPDAEKVLDLEDQVTAAREKQQEIREASVPGRKALDTLKYMEKSLEEADSWESWDMFGEGRLTDAWSHEALDRVQERIERLQMTLRQFRNGLIEVPLPGKLDDMPQFAGKFYDQLFTDWTVMGEVKGSRDFVKAVREDLQRLLEYLDTLLKEEEAREAKLLPELDEAMLLLKR